MSKTKQIIVIIITAIIFFVLGCFISGGAGVIGENTFQAGWGAAEQRLVESGFVSMFDDIEIKSVNGVIEKIDGNKIALKIQPLSPLDDPELDVRIVEINNAKIYKLLEKNQEEFQKEMEAFDKKMQEQMENPEIVTEPIFPPEMFNKQEINLNEIKVGQQITVTADKDIKEIKQFKVVEVIVQFMPAIPQIVEEGLDTLPTVETEI